MKNTWIDLDPKKAVDKGLIDEAVACRRDGTVQFRSGLWGRGPRLAAIPRAAGGWWVVMWNEYDRWGIKRLFPERWQAFDAAKALLAVLEEAGHSSAEEEPPLEFRLLWKTAVRALRDSEDALSKRASGSYGSGKRR